MVAISLRQYLTVPRPSGCHLIKLSRWWRHGSREFRLPLRKMLLPVVEPKSNARSVHRREWIHVRQPDGNTQLGQIRSRPAKSGGQSPRSLRPRWLPGEPFSGLVRQSIQKLTRGQVVVGLRREVQDCRRERVLFNSSLRAQISMPLKGREEAPILPSQSLPCRAYPAHSIRHPRSLSKYRSIPLAERHAHPVIQRPQD